MKTSHIYFDALTRLLTCASWLLSTDMLLRAASCPRLPKQLSGVVAVSLLMLSE